MPEFSQSRSGFVSRHRSGSSSARRRRIIFWPAAPEGCCSASIARLRRPDQWVGCAGGCASGERSPRAVGAGTFEPSGAQVGAAAPRGGERQDLCGSLRVFVARASRRSPERPTDLWATRRLPPRAGASAVRFAHRTPQALAILGRSGATVSGSGGELARLRRVRCASRAESSAPSMSSRAASRWGRWSRSEVASVSSGSAPSGGFAGSSTRAGGGGVGSGCACASMGGGACGVSGAAGRGSSGREVQGVIVSLPVRRRTPVRARRVAAIGSRGAERRWHSAPPRLRPRWGGGLVRGQGIAFHAPNTASSSADA
jgi:hypothetical protein